MLRIEDVYANTGCSIATYFVHTRYVSFHGLSLTKKSLVIDILLFLRKTRQIQKRKNGIVNKASSSLRDQVQSIKHHSVSTKFSTSAKLPVYRYENRQDRSRRCTRRSLSTNERSSLFLTSYIVRYEEQFRVSFPYFPVRFTRPNAIVHPFFSTFLYQSLQTYFLNTSTGGVKWRLSFTRSKRPLPLLRLLSLLSLLPILKSHSNAIFE